MRAYYGSRFSPNQTATPEGFLICHNVPIARTGWYEYKGEEIGVEDKRGQIVQVYRSPEEVFSPAAMASFEGKILTDDHPPDILTPENATRYGKGTVTNVRQGTDDESDLLLADLVAYDENLINEIQQGKREVSCGYDCVYEAMDDGTYQQKQICGNHVAVVTDGRAGDRVAIKDSKTNLNPEGEKKMPEKIVLPKVVTSKGKTSLITNFLAAVGLKHYATDAAPEDIMDAVNAMAEERGAEESNKEEPKPEGTKDQDPAIQALSDQVAKLTELVTSMVKAGQQETKPEDAIDDAIAELEKNQADDTDEEESHTIPVAQLDDEGPVTNPEDRPKSALTGDSAYALAFLKQIKPIIAAIPDPAQRKIAVDAAFATIKSKPAKNTYAGIQKGQKKPALDTKAAAVDHSELGKQWAEKYNPHYKKQQA